MTELDKGQLTGLDYEELALNNNEGARLSMMDRRSFIVGGLGAAALIGFMISGSDTLLAEEKAPKWQDAMNEVLKGAKPVAEKLTIKMPEIAENGNVVSVSIDGTAAENGDARISKIHIFATDNPWPYVASFQFSELSGKPLVTSRMRLARSQKVIAIAELSETEFLIAETFVKVTIGGCGG